MMLFWRLRHGRKKKTKHHTLTAVVQLGDNQKFVVARGNELDPLIAKLSLCLEEEYNAAEGYIEDHAGNILHACRKTAVS